jgi:hypothetical protein
MSAPPGPRLRRSMQGCQSFFPRAPRSRCTVSQVRVMAHQQPVVGRREIAAPFQAGHQREPGGRGHAPEHQLADARGMLDGIGQRQR